MAALLLRTRLSAESHILSPLPETVHLTLVASCYQRKKSFVMLTLALL